MIEHQVASHDGRLLQVLETGDPRGPAVLMHHGTPGSRRQFAREVESAEQHGIRLISYDRPGYGRSSPHPGRAVSDCARDVKLIASTLKIERLGVRGISGGGPHALACAALLPDLVPAVAVLASGAPWGAPGLDYFDGMGQLNVEDSKLMLADPIAARAKCESDRLEMLSSTPDGVAKTLETLLAPMDAEALSGERLEFMVQGWRAGLAPGASGWWDDEVAFHRPWGFELDAIATPVLLYHGRHDRFVPFGHGEWLARTIPGIDARLSDQDGHLTLTPRYIDDVHTWLVERLA